MIRRSCASSAPGRRTRPSRSCRRARPSALPSPHSPPVVPRPARGPSRPGHGLPGAYDAVLVDGWRHRRRSIDASTYTRPGRSRRCRSDKSTYLEGEPIAVSWRAAPGWKWDWLAITKKGAGNVEQSADCTGGYCGAGGYLLYTYTGTPWRVRRSSTRAGRRPARRPGRCRQRLVPRRHVLRRRLFAPRRLAAVPGGQPPDSVGVGRPPSERALTCHCNDSGLSGVLERISDARTISREHPGSSPDSAQETRHGHQRYQAKVRNGSIGTPGLPGGGLSLPGRADRVPPACWVLPSPRRGQRRDRRSCRPSGARLAAPRHRSGLLRPLVALAGGSATTMRRCPLRRSTPTTSAGRSGRHRWRRCRIGPGGSLPDAADVVVVGGGVCRHQRRP